VPLDFPTIQAAVDFAQSGDEIHVSAGTYTGDGNHDIDFHGKELGVIAPSGPAATIIDCEEQYTGFYLHSGETNAATIVGFTIRRAGYSGNGIRCTNASPGIRDCIIEECQTMHPGAGIWIRCTQPTEISDCELRHNVGMGWYGDDGGLGGGIYVDGPVTVRRCVIRDNTVWYGPFTSAAGGGVYARGSACLEDCLIAGNSVLAPSGGGGGVYVGYDAQCTIRRCQILGNHSDNAAGGLLVSNGNVEVVDCLIAGNTAARCAGLHVWSYFHDARLMVSGCTITSNLVTGDGHAGGIGVGGGTGDAWAEVDRSIVWGNCSEGEGSEVWVYRFDGHAEFTCSDLDMSGVGGEGDLLIGPDCIDDDPLFCDPIPCEEAPTEAGDYSLACTSPCLPEFNECGALMGALGVGCGPSPVTATTWGGLKALFR
jgi:hypothetical protein